MRKKVWTSRSQVSTLPAERMILALASASFADVKIAQRSKASARIVLAVDAGETEKWAADELAFFLHLSVGCEIPLISDPAPYPNRLLVGEGAARLAAPGVDAQ